MSRVFISRDLKKDSPFRHRLEKAGCGVTGQSMLRFRAVPFDPPELADWLFFYSPRGVEFFLKKVRIIHQNYQLAAMGPGTADTLREHELEPQFTGSGDPEQVAAHFLAEAEGKRVIFVQARKSRQSVQRTLGNRIQASDLVVYENLPREDIRIPASDVYVFTSPLNVRSFFDRFLFPNGGLVVSIGPVTTAALHTYGFTDVPEADAPREEALAERVLEVLENH